MVMDQARSTITKIFNREPRSYWLKRVGEHMNHHPCPSYASKTSLSASWAMPFCSSLSLDTWLATLLTERQTNSPRAALRPFAPMGQGHVSFSEFSSQSHQAGSPGDKVLANKLMRRFKDYGMNPWTDEHFIRVQDPLTSGANRARSVQNLAFCRTVPLSQLRVRLYTHITDNSMSQTPARP
ncbi:hypothetical protein NFI96_015639 [Prochilodus magdalenae]|nr:hypothetical protein NFI96_015639 [Prochilodus magdalenae]